MITLNTDPYKEMNACITADNLDGKSLRIEVIILCLIECLH